MSWAYLVAVPQLQGLDAALQVATKSCMVLPGNLDETANDSGAVWISEMKRRSPTRSRLLVSVSFHSSMVLSCSRMV